MVQRLIRFATLSPWMMILGALVVGGFGWSAMRETPVDAFPDISENQVIVYTQWMGRSPLDVENQITYPLSTDLQGIPGVRDIRAMSGFGFSQIYVVFEDDVDFYWSRTRVLERLASLQGKLPAGATPQLGPDATALGQIFWYVLDAPGMDLAAQRSLQDYVIRYALQEVDGVAEVASAGGLVRQYQIDVDPNRLKAHDVTIGDVIGAVRRGNIDVGAKTIESSGLEMIVRGLGFIKHEGDVENLVVKARDGTPIFVRDVANVNVGPDFRRGVLADGGGERVGGVVTMRFGANPRDVIQGVKAKIAEVETGLPEGVRIVPFYDRTQLIDETMGTLNEALVQELFITIMVVVLFLLHLRTSLIVAVTLPLAVLMSFIGMRILGLGADIMSLAGIAIAIGTVVDMGIIMSENVFGALIERRPETSRFEAIVEAAAEVGPAILTAVSTTIVSFLPVFFLTGQSGKLFKPLAWTKTFAMFSAVVLAITLVPALCRLFLRESAEGRSHRALARLRLIATVSFAGIGALVGWRLPALGIGSGTLPWIPALASALVLGAVGYRTTTERMRPIDDNPVSRAVVGVYQPTLRWILAHKGLFLMLPATLMTAGIVIFLGFSTLLAPLRPLAQWAGVDLDRVRPIAALDRALPGLGSEFMPPLDEGSYLAMPSLLSQASLSETLEVMQTMNREIERVPEVAQVVGKLGRAETPLDPAPVGMIETVVNLKPKEQWREGVTREDILKELKRVSRIPGTTPSWLQPIETRIVMLQSGIRATMALRVMGAPLKPDGTAYDGAEALRVIEQTVVALEEVVRGVEGAIDVSALRTGGKPYVEIDIDREAIARYGVKVADVQDVIETAVGGINLTWSLEGRERYPVRVQYPRELRDSAEDLARILIPTPSGAQVPMAALADIREVVGPAAVRTENGQLTGYVMFNAFERDETAVINEALAAANAWRAEQRRTTGEDPIPSGLTVTATGRYKNKIEADRRLMVIVPLVLALNFFLIFLQFRRIGLTATIFAAIPVAFGGGFILLWAYPHLLDLFYELGLRAQPSGGPIYLTPAVWIGFIALFGIAVDDGVLVGTYLMQVFARRTATTVEEVRDAVVYAGTRRVRPMLMTTVTTIVALLPILWSTGRGADLMQPMAIPLVGGMVFEGFTMFVVPTIYSWMMERKVLRGEVARESEIGVHTEAPA
jgi:Cu(I)/Ag(I) efflux system membrane protein CusA/SilA